MREPRCTTRTSTCVELFPVSLDPFHVLALVPQLKAGIASRKILHLAAGALQHLTCITPIRDILRLSLT